jgi:hypothetical protein
VTHAVTHTPAHLNTVAAAGRQLILSLDDESCRPGFEAKCVEGHWLARLLVRRCGRKALQKLGVGIITVVCDFDEYSRADSADPWFTMNGRLGSLCLRQRTKLSASTERWRHKLVPLKHWSSSVSARFVVRWLCDFFNYWVGPKATSLICQASFLWTHFVGSWASWLII